MTRNARSRAWCLVALVALGSVFVNTGTRQVGAQEASSGRFVEGEDPLYGRELQNYVTWNLWQGVHWDTINMYVPTDRLWYRVKDSRVHPRAVAVQETCRPAYLDLRAKLAPLGYSGAFYSSNDDAALPCDQHGNAIFWRGECFGGVNQCVDIGPFLNQSPANLNEDDTRGYACGRSRDFSAFYCSAHLTNKNSSAPDTEAYARAQSIEYRQKSEAVQGWVGIPTVFMGDFNIDYRTGNSGFQAWRNQHREADACDGLVVPAGGCYNTFSIEAGQVRDEKLDYIFASKGPGHCFRADDPSFYLGPYSGPGGPVISDHVLVRGYFGCP